MYVVLMYDIVLDEKGAWVSSRVFKTCKKYLCHIQKSVFEGDITPAGLVKLQAELNKYIRTDRDSLIVFKSRDEKWMKKEFWGVEDDITSNFI